MERVVICDFDGTLIKENIEDAFTRYLLTLPQYKFKLILVCLITLPINLFLNKLYHSSIVKSWTFVLGKDIESLINKFINEKWQELTVQDQTIELLNSLECDKCILLTGSYSYLVLQFLKKRRIFYFDSIVGSEVYSNNFIVKRHPFGRAKCKYINNHYYNIGIANDYSDHFFMEMCNENYWIK